MQSAAIRAGESFPTRGASAPGGGPETVRSLMVELPAEEMLDGLHLARKAVLGAGAVVDCNVGQHARAECEHPAVAAHGQRHKSKPGTDPTKILVPIPFGGGRLDSHETLATIDEDPSAHGDGG